MLSLPVVLLTLATFSDLGNAARLSLKGKARSDPGYDRLRRRGNLFGDSTLTTDSNIKYSTNITLNGVPFSALIDTGSSDLWVASASIPNSKATGFNSGVSYAIGQVTGPVMTAELGFAGYTVTDQAFLLIAPDSTNPDGLGLIGLGPNFGSNILAAVGSGVGDPPLDRIFQTNLTTPNYLTVLLGRANDPTDPFPGDLTVGEPVVGYESVLTQPSIPVSNAAAGDSGDQHWQIVLDADSVIGPDGKVIPVTSKVSTATDIHKPTVIFDSGFTFPQVPKSVSDAIYGSVTGAQYSNVGGVGDIWVIPCNQEVNLTFVIAGVDFPIHPLDVSMDPGPLGITLKDGDTPYCLGAFQPVSFNAGSSPPFDMILGMAFLRNAYLLVNFGDFVAGTKNTKNPYIQLLPLTNDTAEMHADFVKVRLGGVDTTTDRFFRQASSTVQSGLSKLGKIIIAAIAIGVLALVILAVCCCKILRRKSNKGSQGGWNPPFAIGRKEVYRPLHDPAPAQDMHIVQGAQPGYNGGYQEHHDNQGYANPWDRR